MELVRPTMEHKKAIMEAREWLRKQGNEEFAGCVGLEDAENYEEWLDTESMLKRKYGVQYVPSVVYLGIEDGKVVGVIDIRAFLSDFLYNYGGSIGYTIFPPYRGKGYGKKMLEKMLELCRENGMDKVLLCCDEANVISRRTMEGCGGILENIVADPANMTTSGRICRYWIYLS